MKALRILPAILASAFLCCCSHETEEQPDIRSLALTTEGVCTADVKMLFPQVGADFRAAVWESGSMVGELKLKERTDSTSALFSGKVETDADGYSVTMPSTGDDTADGRFLVVRTPSAYQLTCGCPGDGAPMYGTASRGSVLMKHLGGFIDLPLIGGGIFDGIEFTALDSGAGVSGRYLVDTSSADPTADAAFSGEGRSVCLRCGSPISVGYDDTLHIFIPLPCREYGSWAVAIDMDGEDPLTIRMDDAPFRVERARATTVAPIKLKSASPLLSFSFTAAHNPRVKSDIPLHIDTDSRSVSALIDYYVGMKDAVADFQLAEGYTAYVNGQKQESGVSRQNFYHPVTYDLVDGDGLATSYTVTVEHFTGLPCVFIETPGKVAIESKDEWLENCTMTIDGVGRYPDYDSGVKYVNVKGRGNATWKKFPKKPFNVKLNKKSEILGMPSHKRWSFIANYRDRTRLGNRVSYYIGAHFPGLDWTSRNEFVELFLNGKHMGNYLLCEQIKPDESRVNVTEFDEDENGNFINVDEKTVTGGYIFQIDSYYNEEFHFRTATCNLPVEFKYPDENVTDMMMSYVKDYFNMVEGYLAAGNYQEAYKYMDVESFVDFWMVAELSGNSDAARPGSDYWHKDRGGVLKAGPIWDYDAFTYMNKTVIRMKNALWYPYLLKDEYFCSRVKEHWKSYKPFLLTIPGYIDSQVEYIRKSEKLDGLMWTPMIGLDSIQGDEFFTFREAVESMKEVYEARMALVEKYINGLPLK